MESQFIGKSGRFVILTHDHPFFHWDLLLEAGETCWTWRLVEGREVRGERREPEEGPRAEGPGPRASGEDEGRGLGEPSETAATLTPSPSPGGRGEPEQESGHPPSATSDSPFTNAPSVPQPSTLNPQLPLIIERIANHRLLYLDHEGPVSGDRGHVARWDWGEYRVTGETEFEITVDLRGASSTWTISLPKAPNR